MSTYCKNNHLALQQSKTVLMHFHSSRTKLSSSPLVRLDGKSIACVSTNKILGLNITDTLDWSTHIDTIAARLSSGCFMLRKLKLSVSTSSLLLVYYAHIHSLLSYGVLFWGSSHHAKRIFIIQKRAVRIIAGLSRRQSCRPHFNNLGILTLPSVLIMNAAIFVRSHPDQFPLNRTTHAYSTRTNSDIFIPSFNHSFYKHSPVHLCSKIFNSLPSNIKHITSFVSFKATLKQFLISHSYYNLDDFFKADSSHNYV